MVAQDGEEGGVGPGCWRPTGSRHPRHPCPGGPSLATAPRPPGHLNRLSLCSPQLNGSGQLKLSSHCLPAQMLAPPPPGLPRLALPPAAKPTSEGGCASPTSPCKHSGSGARGRAGVPEGPSPPSRPCARASSVGPHREAQGRVVRSLRGQGSLGGRQDESGVCSLLAKGPGAPVPTLGLRALPSPQPLAGVGDLKLAARGPAPDPGCLLFMENENLSLF